MDKLHQLLRHDYTTSQLPPSKPVVAAALLVMACMYTMGACWLLQIPVGLLLTILVMSYNPLVPGMKRTWKAHVMLGFIIFIRRIDYIVMTLKGQKPWPLNVVNHQFPIIRDKTRPTQSSARKGVKVTRDEIAGVPVIIYRPDKMASPSPALIFMRGGGFVIGNADMFDETVHEYARRANIMAILIDCGQSPQHTFPEPFNDNLEVTRYVLRHGADLGIDVNNVGVAGDSAGAHFATTVALTLSTEDNSDLPSLKFQVLQVPTVQFLDLRLPSYQDYHKFYSFIEAPSMAVNIAIYLGYEGDEIAQAASILLDNAHQSPDVRDSKYADYVSVKRLPARFQTPQRPLPPVTSTVHHDPKIVADLASRVLDPRLSPLMAPDLSRMPPTFIEVAEFDIFRDEGLLYASRLKESGVEVQVHFSENGYHCDSVKVLGDFLTVDLAFKTWDAATGFIRKVLSRQNEP